MTEEFHTNELNHEQTGVVQAPLHRRIAENLTNQVTSGDLKPGQKLPSERRIANQFNASRATVRTALQHLEQAGLITRRDRRSAVVAIRRDITPFLRIACGSVKMMNLFRRLSEMQLIPPRCQLQLLDLQQPDTLGQMLSQPAGAADIIFCDLEHAGALMGQSELFCELPGQVINEAEPEESFKARFSRENACQAIPLAFSPNVLYYNKAILRERQLGEPPIGDWHWDQLVDMAQTCTHGHEFGFQFRPSFSHLSDIISRMGCELYNENGHITARETEKFAGIVQFVSNMLHERRVSPPLAKVDQINLFIQRRCAMAMDGFDMYTTYRQTLGDDLGVTVLPGLPAAGTITQGLAVLVMKGLESMQPVEDLLRNLLNRKNQLVMAQIGAGLPVRSELLNPEGLGEVQVPNEHAEVFLREVRDFRIPNLPKSLEYKVGVDDLFLEMWLGLDTIENINRRFSDID